MVIRMKFDYTKFSDKELAEELEDLDREIVYWQNSINTMRNNKNRAMEDRDTIISEIMKRGRRGR